MSITQAESDRVAEWYTLHRRTLFRLCYSYLRNVHEADEAVQDTFLKAYRKFRTFRGDTDPLIWLRRIAVNVCLDRVRSFSWKLFRRKVDPEEYSGVLRVEADTERTELHDALKEGLAALSPRQRMVITLRFFEELSIEECADVMGLHVGTVKRHLYRALDRLKKLGGQI